MILFDVSCSLPFTLLFLLAIASYGLSYMINCDEFSTASTNHFIRKQNLNLNNDRLHHSTLENKKVLSENILNLFKSIRNSNSKIKIDFNVSTICIKCDEESCYIDDDDEFFSATLNKVKPKISKHYTCPPTTVKMLRRRYGTNKSYWGEWSASQARQFYKSQLPKALQIEGALGLTLEERAKLASEARHALRIYARERSNIIARIIAELYDGIRHFQSFGYWSSDGMNWNEVKLKYSLKAKQKLGPNATQEEIDSLVYHCIVDKACATNTVLDEMTLNGTRIDLKNISKLIQSLSQSYVSLNIYIPLIIFPISITAAS